MITIVHYWQFNRLNIQGKVTVEEVAEAKRFIQDLYPNIANQASFSDTVLQRDLFVLYSQNNPIAQICLRCFISRQIKQTCINLEYQFGTEHDFTRYDLLPLVLDDTLNPSKQPKTIKYTSIATTILSTFDPNKASLSTWTIRLVRSQPSLNQFLLEHGVYLISDWAILNDTTPKQLQRIFSEFHNYSQDVISQASRLLKAYHDVYRLERLASRQAGGRGKCPVPSPDQLQRISHILKLSLTPEQILTDLQELAERLREYRIFVRGGKSQQDSLSNPDIQFKLEQKQLAQFENNYELQNQDEFLGRYRQQFLTCLDTAIASVLPQWLNKLKVAKKQPFITALKLFHCQGYSMSEIAPAIGLKAQYQVTRLMKLKNLRSDIRQYLLQLLRQQIREMASLYISPEQLLQQEQHIEVALAEQVNTLLEQAETEAIITKHQPLKSFFAQSLCRYLDQKENIL